MKVTELITITKAVALILFAAAFFAFLAFVISMQFPVIGFVAIALALASFLVSLGLEAYVDRKAADARRPKIESGFVPPRPMPPAPAPAYPPETPLDPADRITVEMRERVASQLQSYATICHEMTRQQVMLQTVGELLAQQPGEVTSEAMKTIMQEAQRRADAVPPPAWSPMTGQAVLPDAPTEDE